MVVFFGILALGVAAAVGFVWWLQNLRLQREKGECNTRMRAITESAKDAIMMMDPQGRISYWNPAAERMFGYTSDEAVGQNLHQLIAPQGYHAAHHAAFPEFHRTGRGRTIGQTLELQGRHKDGREIPIALSLSSIETGGEWHALGIVRDETERKQAQESLRESESQFRSLFDNAMVGVAMHEIVLDEHGKPADYIFVQANPAFETHTGLRVADVLGKRVTEVLPGIREEQFIEIYGKVALTGKPTTFEQFSESLQRHYHVSAYSLGHGRFAAVFQDITQRKRLEAQVARSLYQLEDITANIPNGMVWQTDVRPDGSFENTFFSSNSDRLLDLPAGTLQHSIEKWFTFVLPEDLPRVQKAWTDGIADPGSTHIPPNTG